MCRSDDDGRRVNDVAVPLRRPMALGRTAEIYAWEEGWVLKLFNADVSPRHVAHEAHIARAVQESGLPVPRVRGVVHVDGRQGLIYQTVDGQTMRQDIARRPWRIVSYARRAAELHEQMHACVVPPGLPGQRQKLEEKIREAAPLPESLRAKALDALDTLPEGGQLCHGDFHPDNIMMSRRGEILIDWIDATRGNPLADLARTSILLLGAADCQLTRPLEKAIVHIFHAAYIRRYFRHRPDDRPEYRCWLPVVAAARLSENIAELESWLIARADSEL